MYPSAVSETTSVCIGGYPVLPSICCPYHGKKKALHVTMRGGFSFIAPLEASITTASGVSMRVKDLRTGMMMWSPYQRVLATSGDVPYDYIWLDNRKIAHREKGMMTVTRDQAELLGWLIGGGTIASATQSIRFASSDVWVLKHVERLTAAAFPSVSVKWYAKHAGYDLTLTAGINNPLRHFLRAMQLTEGFPLAIGLFKADCLYAFLQGLWGADGWVCVRKGGNDVEMGMTRSTNRAFTSLVRDTHASIGMHGLCRKAGTKDDPMRHRLIFSGYPNYRIFADKIRQVGNNRVRVPPIKRSMAQLQTEVDIMGHPWYKTPIQRIVRIKDPVCCYEVRSVRRDESRGRRCRLVPRRANPGLDD